MQKSAEIDGYLPVSSRPLIFCRQKHLLLTVTSQRRRDDSINKNFAFEGGGGLGGREENRPKNDVFHGKRHDNRILKGKFYCREILLSLRRLLTSWPHKQEKEEEEDKEEEEEDKEEEEEDKKEEEEEEDKQGS